MTKQSFKLVGAAEIQKGDHLISPRIGYEHHGIYLGNGEVIHYSGFGENLSAGKVEVTSLDKFTQNNGYQVKEHHSARFDVEQRIDRAKKRLGEDSYHLIFNNCEHFVNWCIHDRKTSQQVTQAAIKVSAVVVAAGVGLMLKRKMQKNAKGNQA